MRHEPHPRRHRPASPSPASAFDVPGGWGAAVSGEAAGQSAEINAVAERLTSPEMVEAVARSIADEQMAGRVEYKRRVGYQGRRSLARAALDVVCRELGVPDSVDHLLASSTPLREAVEAHTRALLAFDCVEDEVPDDIDVPDDYERGLHDAATGYAQILADQSIPSGAPQ